MRNALARRLLLQLLTVGFLLGQAAGLEHIHAASADCPPTACLHHETAPDSRVRLVGPDECPLCELLAQGRSVTTNPLRSVSDASAGPTIRLAEPARSARPSRSASGLGARAPPRVA